MPQLCPKVPKYAGPPAKTGRTPLVVEARLADDRGMDTLIIESRALGTRPTAVVSADLTVDELKIWLGEAFHTVADHLRATGNAPTGLPFARYHRLDENRFHVEAGFPVAQHVEPSDGVRGSNLPGGDVAVTTHIGPYDDLEATYEALGTWLESRTAAPAGDAWEVYFTGPDEPPSQWRTDIYQPYTPGLTPISLVIEPSVNWLWVCSRPGSDRTDGGVARPGLGSLAMTTRSEPR